MHKNALSSKLTKEQATKFGEYAAGLAQKTWNDMTAWRNNRTRWYRRWNGDYSDRAQASRHRHEDFSDDEAADNIRDVFARSNDPEKSVHGIIDYMTARAIEELGLLNSDKFFSMEPDQGALEAYTDPKKLSADLSVEEDHAHFKLDEAKFDDTATEFIERAGVAGEGLVMPNFVRLMEYREQEENVLAGDGEKIVTPLGYFITRENSKVESIMDVLDPEDPDSLEKIGERYTHNITGESVETTDYESVEWETSYVDSEVVEYEGLKHIVVHHDDIIAPLNVADLNDARIVGRQFKERLSVLAQTYDLAEDVVEKLRKEACGQDEPETGASAKKAYLSEARAGNDDNPQGQEDGDGYREMLEQDPEILCYHLFLRHDPTGKGRNCRVEAIVSKDSKQLLFGDYLVNQSAGGVLPVFVHRFRPVAGRWYGQGFMEMYEEDQDAIDRQWNTIQWQNKMTVSPQTWVNVNYFKLDDEDETPVLNWDTNKPWLFDFPADVDPKRVFGVVEIPDNTNSTTEQMERLRGNMQVRSGVSSATTGQVGDIPSNNTATGVEAILSSGNTLFVPQLERLKRSIARMLEYDFLLLYQRLEKDETFVVEEEDGSFKTQTLSLDTARQLKARVKLVMTKVRTRQQLERINLARDVLDWYLGLQEFDKDTVRPMVVDGLKRLGFNDAEDMVRKAIMATDTPPDDSGQAQPVNSSPSPPSSGGGEPEQLELQPAA